MRAPVFSRLFTLAILLSIGSCRGLCSPAFEVSGNVTTSAFEPDGKTNTFIVRYRASINTCKAAIRATLPTNPRVQYYEYTTDGQTSSFMVRYSDTNLVSEVFRSRGGKLEKINLPVPVSPANQASLILRSNVVPEYGFDFITTLWLAFVSKCFYASQQTGGTVAPIFSMGEGYRESGGRVRAQWSFDDIEPGFLKYMCDFSDGREYRRTGSKLTFTSMPKPFDKGFTNSVFNVLQWTNVSSLRIPFIFELLRFAPQLGSGNQQKLQTLYTCKGTVDSVRISLSVTNFTPDIPMKCRVTDYTVSDKGTPFNGYTYLTTNGTLLTFEELKLEPQFQLAMRTADRAVAKTRKQYFLFACFLVTLIIPLAVAWGRKFSRLGQDKHST
jgi:hypothetical protein